jgi:Protein of unknown function (DUF2975)
MNSKNPLGKLEIVIATIGSLMIFGLLTTVPSALSGHGDFFGFGSPEVCANVPSQVLLNDHGHGLRQAHVKELADGASARATDFDLCATDPSLRQRSLATLVDLSRYVFFLGFLFITWRLTRRGRRRGLFTSDVAMAVDRLSVYLFAGAFVVPFVRALATQKLVATMLVDPAYNDWMRYVHLSWVLIIVAFGLQAMARVMAAAVPMQAEIDATV